MIEMSKSFKEKEKDTEEDGNHIKSKEINVIM